MTTTDLLKATEDASGGWIATYTGRQVTPLAPDPDTLDPLDIAHALSNQCRFTGHTREFYSTAQHSVLVSRVVPDEDALWGLMHDASEAYISDIARPVKRHKGFGEFYGAAEDILMEAVCARFGLPVEMPTSVKEADNLILWAEMRDLMPNDPPDGVAIYSEPIDPWSPASAKSKFLERYEELTGEVYEGYYGGKGMGSTKLWRYAGKLKA